jgi:hypothetical protein
LDDSKNNTKQAADDDEQFQLVFVKLAIHGENGRRNRNSGRIKEILPWKYDFG